MIDPIEILAALLGLANILLVVRRSVWNFPVAIAMVSLFAVIFWNAKLYSDAGLQFFFIAVNMFGWWQWTRNSADDGEIEVRALAPAQRVFWLAGAVAAALIWGLIMSRTTDATHPWWDASIAMWSVAAQFLLAWRYIENWHGWIAVNLVSVPLYATKGLYVSAGLYAVLLIIAIWGLIEWRRIAAKQSDGRQAGVFV